MDQTLIWSPDRRRSPRVDLLIVVAGHVVTVDEQVRVTQLNLLGMTVETGMPLSARVRYAFAIRLDEIAFTVPGRVIHTRVVVEGDSVTYVAGIEFVSLSPDESRGIAAILDASCAHAD